MGNGEVKDRTCTTHGHELRGGIYWRKGGAGQMGIKGRKIMG